MPNDMHTNPENREDTTPETNTETQAEITAETCIVTIEALTTEGQGIARIQGLEGDDTRGYTVFCDGLLPGEEAEIRI